MKNRFLLAAVFLLAVSTGVRGDAGGCQAFGGDFTSTLVPPPTCTSPVGICTHGLLTGNFKGTYDFTMTTLECGVLDPDDPNLCTYTGDSVVTSKGGTAVTADTGVMQIAFPVGVFTTTADITGGSGRFKKASGTFVATGELNFVTGDAVGDYSLQICHNN